MKKVLAVLTLALFIGGITVPAVAAISNNASVITLMEEDPAKKTTEKKSEVKAEKKSGDCAAPAEKSEAAKKAEKKSSDCSSTADKSKTAKK
jgi:hypothetical protein